MRLPQQLSATLTNAVEGNTTLLAHALESWKMLFNKEGPLSLHASEGRAQKDVELEITSDALLKAL
jgi:hypothetical protein